MPLQSHASQRSRRALAAGLVLAVLSVTVPALVARSSAATPASTTLCSGFDSCAKSGMPHDGYDTAKSQMYWKMYSGVNCTNYVAYRMIRAGMSATRPAELKSGKGNATYWGGSFGSLTNQIPMVGSVAWWKANTNGVGDAGHVARVEQVLDNGDVVISESNYGSEFTWRRLAAGGNRWPSGFIHLRDTALVATAAPSLGTPTVGVALTVNPGGWSPAATTYSYQWFVGSTPIGGANGASYTPTPDTLGKTLAVQVSANRNGYVAGVASSAQSAAVLPGTQTVTADPAVSGIAQVDETLTVNPGAYLPGAEAVSVQWLADNKPIAGATGTTFVPNKEQSDARLSVRVTAVRQGYTSLVRTSSPTAPVLAPDIQVASAGIAGVRQVGQTLSAAIATADPVAATQRYSWLRDGKPIKGARSSTYTLRPTDVGHKIGLRVALSSHGYLSRKLDVPSFGGIKTPLATVIKTDPQRNGSVWVKVLLKPPAGPMPTGPVDIKVGKELHHGLIAKDGTVRLLFTHPGAGLREIKVYYGGNARFLVARATGSVTMPVKHRK